MELQTPESIIRGHALVPRLQVSTLYRKVRGHSRGALDWHRTRGNVSKPQTKQTCSEQIINKFANCKKI